MNYTIEITTKSDKVVKFECTPEKHNYTEDSISLQLEYCDGNLIKTTVTAENEQIKSINHIVSTPLRNFTTIIAPDGGRNYSRDWQPVYFWDTNKFTNISNICLPIFIANNQTNHVGLAIGIIGDEYETQFRCLEPRQERALMAFYKRFTVSINRLCSYKHVNTLTEYLYFQDNDDNLNWTDVLWDYSQKSQRINNTSFQYNYDSMQPLWCSWTDWHSDNVNEEVVLDNIAKGVKLGIKNYIIDDGWFGPGLDSSFDIKLNIGDWECDKSKFKDLKKLSDKIHSLGAKSIIWCAPHAVGEAAKCRNERLPYLVKDENNKPVTTYNEFNVLCVRNKEARDIMIKECVRLAVEYDTDGAKYDLFNCIPDVECCSLDHQHDTESAVHGLYLLLKGIWTEIKKIKPEYIIELKQNYGGTILANYGTMVRAGDTPYCPDGNFLRTAFIQSYTPFAANDYQTITDFDNIHESAIIVIKMMAVGVPTYSMDICKLKDDTCKMLAFLNHWYIENISTQSNPKRYCLDGELSIWYMDVPNKQKSIYFILNDASQLSIIERENFDILSTSVSKDIILNLHSTLYGEYEITHYSETGDIIKKKRENISKQYILQNEGVLISFRKIKQ